MRTAAITAAQTTAGLQKWVYDAGAMQWKLAYTRQSGLNLGQPYSVAGCPAGSRRRAAVGTGDGGPA